MKKVLLSLAVIFVMSSFTTTNTDAEKMNVEIPTIAEAGCARDCVDYSLETIEPMNDTYKRRMSTYLWIYEICYNRNCKK